jgi:tetratricopeptide (TPR) repeat protein
MRLRRLLSTALVALVPLVVLACSPGAGGKTPQHPVTEAQTAALRSINDDAFPDAVHDLLLSEPHTLEHDARLAGVIDRQMTRAQALYKRRAHDRATTLVTGGLYLIRSGDLKKETLGTSGKDSIALAAKDLAGQGDEGRSRAIYEILARIAPPPEQPDIKFHLDALTRWQKDTVGEDPSIAGAGEAQAQATARRLLEPSPEALDAANGAVLAWLERARDAATSKNRSAISQYERAEAVRALQTGGSTLVALYLRDADARGAIEAVDRAEIRPIVPARLYAAVAAAADKPSADAWIAVLAALFPKAGSADDDDDDGTLTGDILRVPAFNVAIEAYRLDPTRIEAAATVAEGLQIFGMGDASPAVLADACRAHPDATTLSIALQTTVRAIEGAEQEDDVAGARRAFKAAAPILELARKSKDVLKPPPTRVLALMGDIELREGELDAARARLKDATASGVDARALLDLARIELHDGDAAGAKGHLKTALTAPESRDPAFRTELLLLLADADPSAANTYLDEALKLTLAARTVPDASKKARAERALGRVLERYGQDAAADRALLRAVDAAPRDRSQLATTLGVVVGRAFLRNDLPAARAGLSRAIAGELDDDDIVYYALWVRALEKLAKAKGDGTPERVFAHLDEGSWSGKLAAYALGKLDANALLAAAATPAKKMEATFYIALDKRAAGDKPGSDALLGEVAKGPAIDLLETQYATALLKPRATVALPAGVNLP